MSWAQCRVFLVGSRRFRSYSTVYSGVTTSSTRPERARYDAVVIGAGHNGLVAAAYLAKAGKKVAVFERRHLVGGAAVTEEIVPEFLFSRASYLLSLLRPVIVRDLELERHGLKFYFREPSSYTPIRGTKDYLMLGSDGEHNAREIAKFSAKDSKAYGEYEAWLERMVDSLDPLLDSVPINLSHIYSPSRKERWSTIRPIMAFGSMISKLKKDLPTFYDIVMSPASKVLESWFESEVLRATLATDAVIGAMISPYQTGSGYVLLHHVMGEMNGRRNAWVYPEGGMGAVSAAIARSALSHGVELFTEQPVRQILVDGGRAKGVKLEDGTEVAADLVLSNATPKITFLDLLPEGSLPEEFHRTISSFDYTSPVTKINVALSGLPNFTATPNPSSANEPGPNHYCTIHLNCETMALTHQAYLDAEEGIWSRRPIIEMCIPSSLDPTLAPRGCHVASLFTQYTPYHLKHSPAGWTEEMKGEYLNLVFNCIEEYAPGFRELVVGYEILTPPDLEQVFGLTGGNVFHGALSMDQLYMTRPTYMNSTFDTPGISGLFLCGSGAHPGGGVMGAPGRLAALTALKTRL